MLTPAEADKAIEASLPLLPTEPCELERAAGRVLREAVAADLDQPPFDRVAMDGIALRFADYAAGRRAFHVDGIVAAGARPATLESGGRCLEVMTGAVLPPGADAVVPLEDLVLADGVATLAASARVRLHGNVHRRASDVRAGALVLPSGTRLGGPEVAIAAAAGRTTLAVSARPRIAVISTGDELVPPGTRPAPWQVRRSNAYGIGATLAVHGHPPATDLHLADDLERIRAALEVTLDRHEVVVMSGGVSAGRYDHVPRALAAAGVRQVFHKVAQRPGKPLWFGVRDDGRAVFALPGNPVSTLVCLVRYVLPALERLSGARPTGPTAAWLAGGWSGEHAHTAFVPVRVPAAGAGAGLELHETHGSGDFTALAGTVGFVELAGGRVLEPGARAPLYTW
jgi:molybdopterin molybdotransferase